MRPVVETGSERDDGIDVFGVSQVLERQHTLLGQAAGEVAIQKATLATAIELISDAQRHQDEAHLGRTVLESVREHVGDRPANRLGVKRGVLDRLRRVIVSDLGVQQANYADARAPGERQRSSVLGGQWRTQRQQQGQPGPPDSCHSSCAKLYP